MFQSRFFGNQLFHLLLLFFLGDHDPKVTGSQWFTTCRAKDVRCFDLQPHTAKFEVAASMVWKGFSWDKKTPALTRWVSWNGMEWIDVGYLQIYFWVFLGSTKENQIKERVMI